MWGLKRKKKFCMYGKMQQRALKQENDSTKPQIILNNAETEIC